jgi:hypothetical protein
LVLIYFLIALSLCHSGSPTMVLWLNEAKYIKKWLIMITWD